MSTMTAVARSITAARLRPAPGVWCTYLDDHALLFDGASRRLHRLNTAAAFIWGQIEDGLDEPEIIAACERILKLPPTTASLHVHRTLSLYRNLGLLAGDTRPIAAPPPPQEPALPPQATQVAAGSGRAVELPAGQIRRCYELGGQLFVVRYGDADLAEAVAPYLHHVERTPACHGAVVLDVGRVSGRILVGRDGLAEVGCGAVDGLVPLLKGYLAWRLLQGEGRLAFIHAAALARDGACLLLPGASGSGKSTLSAGLSAAGWRFMGDDLAPLDAQTMRVWPTPFGICVKQSGWGLVGRDHTCLGTNPVHRRFDGQTVRYLMPSGAPPRTAMPVRWMVFPSYRPGQAARIEPLDRAAALQRLVLHVQAPDLEECHLRRLAQWLKDVECFEVGMPDLDQGLALIARATGCEAAQRVRVYKEKDHDRE